MSQISSATSLPTTVVAPVSSRKVSRVRCRWFFLYYGLCARTTRTGRPLFPPPGQGTLRPWPGRLREMWSKRKDLLRCRGQTRYT